MNANPFNIWGKATTTRDFIHIDDIVDAVITMRICSRCQQRKTTKGGYFQIYNQGQNEKFICFDCRQPKNAL